VIWSLGFPSDFEIPISNSEFPSSFGYPENRGDAMPRRPASELEFGSDSFLDIIANIVGVLIILIVIAGLRAARAPVPSPPSKKPSPSPVVAALKPKPKRKPVPIPPPKVEPEPVVEIELPPPPRPVLRPPVPTPGPQLRDDLLVAMRRLRDRIAALTATRKQLEDRLRRVRSAQRSLDGSKRTLAAELLDGSAVRQRLQKMIAALQAEADRGRTKLAELRRQYDEAGRKPDNVKTVRHRLTPVGEQVTGKEIHFRVAEGKVALVPIDELVARLREEVIHRKSWLLKFPTQRGTVGPIGGFEMQYAVQRQLSSALDELRGGYGQIKVVLNGWKIEPTPELQAESADRALRPGSRFLQEIHVADNTATVTFWVYPDSFGAFRKLQGAVHREGLRVAARPLPFGIPIAGSPRGSRSSGQ
jgi:hypothetical protein